jgi:hypothetical protein
VTTTTQAVQSAAQQLPLYDIDVFLREALRTLFKRGLGDLADMRLLVEVETEMFDICGGLPLEFEPAPAIAPRRRIGKVA